MGNSTEPMTAVRIQHNDGNHDPVAVTAVAIPVVALADVEAKRDDLGALLLEQAQIESDWKAAQEQFERDHADLMMRRDYVKAAVKGTDAGLREQAVAYYTQNRDGGKTITNGVKIEEVTVAVYEPAALRAYALQFMPDLLVLNLKAVDELALALYAHKTLAAAFAPMPLKAEKQPRAEISADTLTRMSEVKANVDALADRQEGRD